MWLTLALLLAACSNPLEKANQEAALAEQFLRQGNLPAARMAIGRALSYRDDQANILLLDAVIKFQMQDYRAAYDGYRTVLAFDPYNVTALVGVAQLGASLGEVREAREAIDKALAIDPRQPEALMAKGVLALESKNYEEAVAIGTKLEQNLPSDPRGLVLQSRGKFLMGERGEALTMLRDAAANIGNNPMISTALLENARAEGDVPIMLEQLAYLRELNPRSVDLAIDEANVRYKSGDIEGARKVGIEVLARFGDDGETVSRLTDLWHEYDADPLTASDIAAIASEGGLEARLAVARELYDKGQYPAAQSLVAGIKDDRANGLAARIEARANGASGYRRAQAILAKDKTNCDALAAVAEWHLAHGQPGEAVAPAQVVATQCLDRNDGVFLLVDAYKAAERKAGVERVFRQGLDAHSLDRRVASAFAEWLMEQGRTREAVSAARHLTRSAPSKVSSWKLFEDICRRADNQGCLGDAMAGAARAKQNYAMDFLPGQRRPNPILGQSWR